jgi:hypothetical protein
MAKTFEKVVTGFNHNIKHKGKVYHVQTEDSGAANPHIITHLFVGGNILASKKTGYADIVQTANLAELVREMMEEQHKEMLRNLINGVYDNIDSKHRSYQPGQLATDAEAQQAQHQQNIAVALGASTAATTAAAATAAAAAAAAKVLPPEVVAAREMKELPKINDVGVETLFGEDLISEKSLDEVILSYLAGDGDAG